MNLIILTLRSPFLNFKKRSPKTLGAQDKIFIKKFPKALRLLQNTEEVKKETYFRFDEMMSIYLFIFK